MGRPVHVNHWIPPHLDPTQPKGPRPRPGQPYHVQCTSSQHPLTNCQPTARLAPPTTPREHCDHPLSRTPMYPLSPRRRAHPRKRMSWRPVSYPGSLRLELGTPCLSTADANQWEPPRIMKSPETSRRNRVTPAPCRARTLAPRIVPAGVHLTPPSPRPCPWSS